MVSVRMAQAVIADAQRAVHDKAIYKPQAPLRRKNKDKNKGKKPAGRTLGYSGSRHNVEQEHSGLYCAQSSSHHNPEPEPEAQPRANRQSDGMLSDRGQIGRRYREARPWLSAREVRLRATEDLREREAMPVGSSNKHTYSVAPRIGLDQHQARRAPAQRILDSRHVATMPREIRHIKRVALPTLTNKTVEKKLDIFGQGDKVTMKGGEQKLAFGKLKGWSAEPDAVGTVLMGGKRWKGDYLVQMGGQRLWLKCDELVMVDQSDKPRPTTAEELKSLNKRRAAERKKRSKAARVAQMKWQQKIGGNSEDYEEDVLQEEEIVNFFEEMDNDGSGLLDRNEVKELLVKLGRVCGGPSTRVGSQKDSQKNSQKESRN